MPDEIKIEDTERTEPIVVEVLPPSETPKPDKLVETKRRGGISRAMPLSETHGQTTEANRFRET